MVIIYQLSKFTLICISLHTQVKISHLVDKLFNEVASFFTTCSKLVVSSGAGRSIIGGWRIFIYPCSQSVKTIDLNRSAGATGCFVKL